MSITERPWRLSALAAEQGLLTAGALSKRAGVSERIIRRDLERLEQEGRRRRTFGGAASTSSQATAGVENEEAVAGSRPESFLGERFDVLIATSVNPKYDGRLLESISRRNIPIIAESMAIQDEESVVAVDNYQAGLDMGRW